MKLGRDAGLIAMVAVSVTAGARPSVASAKLAPPSITSLAAVSDRSIVGSHASTASEGIRAPSAVIASRGRAGCCSG